MSKMVVPTPCQCACCDCVNELEGTLTLNSRYLQQIGLPKGWVVKATDVFGHQLIAFVCATCNAKGLSP